jgi:hypothetical protein
MVPVGRSEGRGWSVGGEEEGKGVLRVAEGGKYCKGSRSGRSLESGGRRKRRMEKGSGKTYMTSLHKCKEHFKGEKGGQRAAQDRGDKPRRR